MEHRRTFGRRAGPQSRMAELAPRAPLAEITAAVPLPVPAPVLPSIEDEIEEWKRTRGHDFSLPWRQLSLMAGLCFGVASLILPATVNDAVQWPLYILAAIGFYAGLRKRKDKAA
jgi:hypothetical protein